MSHQLTKLRQQCQTRLRQLELTGPVDVERIRQIVVRQRGRPLEFLPLASDLGPFGLWVATARADYIFFARDTTPLHQQHIVLHEISHILCGHSAAVISENDLLRMLLPDLQPALVHSLLGRSAYAASQEQEAEMLATLLLERGSAQPMTAISADTDAAVIVQRLVATLTDLPGWSA